MTDIPTIAKGLSEARDIPDELVEAVRQIMDRASDNADWASDDGKVYDFTPDAIAAIRAVLDWQAAEYVEIDRLTRGEGKA